MRCLPKRIQPGGIGTLYIMCRFHSDNIDVFNHAIKLMKPIAYELDVFGRTPLHIACSKISCMKVIKLILNHCGNAMLVVKTKYLKVTT